MKSSYKLFNYKNIADNRGPRCFYGVITSLDPFLVEWDNVKIKLLLDESKKNFKVGDFVRVYLRLSFSEDIPFGVPDIIKKVNENPEIFMKNLIKYIGDYYGKIDLKEN